MEGFETKFPQLFVSICLSAFEDADILRQYGFWLLNRASFVDVDVGRPNATGILILVDVNAKSASITYGYALMPYLNEDSTFAALSAGHPLFLQGDYPGALKAVIQKLEAILIKGWRKVRKDPASVLARGGQSPKRVGEVKEMKPALILTGVLAALLPAQENVDLPTWEDDELKALESGEYVPGSALMGEIARKILDSEVQEVIELDPMVLDLPEEIPVSEELSKFIGEEFISAYFHQPPDGFLNDPQKLLTSQEYLDREGFLEFHAKNDDDTRDTVIDCYLYLFDERQEIPIGESLEDLVKSKFDPRRPAAIVFYFMGNPERSQLVFSDPVIKAAQQEDRDTVLRKAIEEALEKSDPSSQLDSFSMQLSIRLNWLVKVVGNDGASLLWGSRFVFDEDEPVAGEGDGIWERIARNELLLYLLTVVVILVPTTLLGLLGRWILKKRRVYLFPDAEGSPLLEAPHAAGVGGVLSFASSTAPPSSQKKDDPNYLQQM